MGKKKKLLADRTRSKRKGPDKKINPFEVKINRQKHNVLGRKISKFDKGMPGVSRSKAINRRKATLLKEYEERHKNNRFVDKRFGEHDTSLSLEEKMMRRYAMERSRTTTKSKFNLNEEEEELTHYGQSLADIEKFDEPVISDDEDDDDDDKRAAAKLVAQEHFGGFLQRRNPDDDKKSWKERMEDMIKESKKKKYERQAEKEETVQMTVELDEQWKALHSLVSTSKLKGKGEDDSKQGADDYDIAVRSLQFEMKGQATDRLKSEEELARDEKERLEKREADRIRRMKGLTDEETSSKSKYRSADDLDDGFALESQDFDYVSYKDGQLNKEHSDDKVVKDDDVDDDDQGSGYTDDEACDDVNEDAENVDNDDEDDVVDKDDIDVVDQNIGKANDDSSSEESDDYEDLESDKEEETTRKAMAQTADDRMKLSIMEKAKKELPYTFKAPAGYNELLDILEGHNMEDQLTIIERIRRCHHPSLGEGNKDKLETLFSHLVQFYGDLCIQDPPQLDFVDRLIHHLYELTQMSRETAGTTVTTSLTDRHEEFAQICQKRAGRGLYPGLDTLLLFKLVSMLFPTSDFRHSVATPSLLFMCQILGQSPVNNGRDVVAGLFLCNLCLQYVFMSKRFIPEVINFLHGLLFYAADKEPDRIETVMPPFKPVGKTINLLHITNKVNSLSSKKWSLAMMLEPVVDEDLYSTDQFRITAVYQCSKLLGEFSKLWFDLASYKDIFTPVLYMCNKLPRHKYPTQLQTVISDFTSSCEQLCHKTRPALMMQKKKPKPLKMFEPQVEEKFDGRKKGRRGTRDFNEKQKLIHKYKKEMKGAVRELKKDTKFLARRQLQETMGRDAERKRRVKEIMGGLAHQEGDYKKMKRGVKPD